MAFVDLKNHFVFRRIFAIHPEILRRLLNDLLEREGERISICDFELWPDAAQDAAGLPRVPMLSRWNMTERSSGNHGLLQIQYAFLELPKLPPERPQTGAGLWAWLFVHAPELQEVPPDLPPGPYRQAMELANEARFTPAELDAYRKVFDEIDQLRELAEVKWAQGQASGFAKRPGRGPGQGDPGAPRRARRRREQRGPRPHRGTHGPGHAGSMDRSRRLCRLRRGGHRPRSGADLSKATTCSLAATTCSLAAMACSLAATICSLAATTCSLVATTCSLVATTCRLLAQKRSRAGWAEAAQALHDKDGDRLLDEPTPTRFEEHEWHW